MRERPVILAVALLGCDPPPSTIEPAPTPPDPLVDTALPEPSPTTQALRVELGAPAVCTDIGRAEHYYDRIDLGPAPVPFAHDWRGSGLAIEDFDGDGHPEVFVPGVARSALFRWDGTDWVDVAATALAGLDLPDAVGAAPADYDADGDVDLFVTRFGRSNVLLRNDAGVFTDVTAAAGLDRYAWRTASATWGDVDGDGWLDLLVGSYGERPPDAHDQGMPPGDPSELWRNRGDGTFEDHTASLPASVHDSYTFMTALIDLDGDHLPELLNVADFGWVRPSSVSWNRGGFTFEPDDGTAQFHPNFAGMGLAIGDLNADGLPDFAQSSYRDLSVLISSESAFSTSGVLWVEFAQALGIAADPERGQAFGWGTELADLDLDGDLDLLMGFGHWSEYVNVRSQADGVWVNHGAVFDPVSSALWRMGETGATRGLLVADLDEDGWPDVVKRILDRPVRVHRSRCAPVAHFVKVAVRDEATPNRRAVGAKVRVLTARGEQTRWQGLSTSIFSGGPAETHFGLGQDAVIERLEITWPDGEVRALQDVPVDRRIVVTREAP